MIASWEQTRLDHRERQAASIAASALALLTEHGASALTMAAIAEGADVSRPTLYRYYDDVDAVLIGIVKLVTAHDDEFVRLVLESPDPRSQLDAIAAAAVPDDRHGADALVASLPPAGREIVDRHRARICALVADVLRRGVDDGSFRADLRPDDDAPLILSLLAATDSGDPDRAISLVRRLTEPDRQEPTA